jgi:hypothetical protein
MGGRGSAGRTLIRPPRPSAGESLGSRIDRLGGTAARVAITKGDSGGLKEKLTLSDGTEVFSKAFSPDERNAAQCTDAEELAAKVAQALDAPIPQAHRRDGELRVFTEWVEGTALTTARRRRDGDARAEEMLAGRPAQRLGLVDILTANSDRHEANMVVTKDGGLVGIDQGQAWNGARWLVREPNWAEGRIMQFMQGPGSRHFGGQSFLELGPNPLTRADVATIRERLTALRPDFERRGRGEWLDASLIALNLLERHATGTRSIFDE